jgi:hypothetical protein
MTDRWYLVKRNWSQTPSRCPNYGGIGGDVWPLDPQCGMVQQAEEKAVHSHVMAKLQQLIISGQAELVCLDRALAEEYWGIVNSRTPDGWLLEVSLASDAVPTQGGIDIGFPSGGFSLVESELITQGRRGPDLNSWGLIANTSEAEEYMAQRESDEELEHLSRITLLSVSILRFPV